MKKTVLLLISMVFVTVGLAWTVSEEALQEVWPFLSGRSADAAGLEISEGQSADPPLAASEAKIATARDYTVEGQTVFLEEDSESVTVGAEAGDSLQEQLTKEQSALLRGQQENSYSFSQLTDSEQEVYLEILWTLSNLQENVALSSLDKEEISRIFQCVLNDHPEIFYVNGYTYTQYTLANVLKKITISGTYGLDSETIQNRQVRIEDYVNQCLAGLPAGADEYATVKYIYEYIIDHTEYDAQAKDNQNICSVFLDGRSVCQGYAKATQYLLQRAGIGATLVLGMVSEGEGHAWNLVQIDGSWYYVDTTWGDASYQTADGQAVYPEQKIPTINYDYLCVTTEQLCKTHVIDNVVELPECSDMQANYYVREGLYFTSLDEEQLTGVFQEGYAKGTGYVTIKCASGDVYAQMERMLIEEQEIFHYLDCPDGVVSYTDNAVQYSMSFWL